jgi:hypothetical protein
MTSRAAQRPPGTVVLYLADPARFGCPHEVASRNEIGRRLAAILGFQFAGGYDLGARYPGAVYLVPSDTLVGTDLAATLGIRGEDDLFGGVVPHAFVATKAITHSLVRADASAPAGWSRDLGPCLGDCVLHGHTVFTVEDARLAGARLLAEGPVRFKPVLATGGRGQEVVGGLDRLEELLAAIDPAELTSAGLVLEEDLASVTTCSVGQVRVGPLEASYYGTQRLTPDHDGVLVYGGSDLLLARGGFDRLLDEDLAPDARVAVAQARAYDAAASRAYPGLIASRRNYDVAQGLDARGRRRSGVLEQSWRLGGASGAEIAALEAFKADLALRRIRASTVEVYGLVDPPPGAVLYFRGVDEQIGPITKYALVESDGHAG